MATTEKAPPPFPKGSKPTEQKTELMKNLETCKTLDDLLNLLKSLETVCDDQNDTDIAVVCVHVALYHYDPVNSDVQKPELLLSYGNRASEILAPFETYFRDNSLVDNSFHLFVLVLRNLWLCGTACRVLNRNDECLDYFSRASKIGDASFSGLDVEKGRKMILNILAIVENELATCNKRLGMPDEKIVPYFRKGTDIQEMFADEYDVELGKSFMNMCTGYVRVRDFKQALPYCLKAIKIFSKNYGEESMEVVEGRRYLGTIYGSLGDHDKALEELRVSMEFLKSAKPGSKELVEEEIRCGTYLLSEGKYEEAIKAIEAVGPEGVEDKGLRGMAFLNMAQAYYRLGDLVEARRCAEKCGSSFDKKVDQVPFAGYVAHILFELAELYEEMSDLGKAMLCIERLLTMPEKLPLRLLTTGTAKYNLLVSITDKEEEGLRYLKIATRKLKEGFGANNVQVGIAYSYLGQACLKLKKYLTAAEFYKEAKEIMDATLGPYHENSVKVCMGLVLAYKGMDSQSEAIRVQEMVDERLKGNGPKTRKELEEAVRDASVKPFQL